MIGIIDYGMGNLFSVSKGLERLGAESFISDNPEELAKADGIILPGVGSFRDAMALLEEKGLDQFVKQYVADGGYLLGICLGMQLLFDESEENGPTHGLSLIPGKVVRFAGRDENGFAYKVPHMGWNRLVVSPSFAVAPRLRRRVCVFCSFLLCRYRCKLCDGISRLSSGCSSDCWKWQCLWHAISSRKKRPNGHVTVKKLFVISREKGGP